jgi:hypothetical protein
VLGFLQREVFDGVFRHFDRMTAPVFYPYLREENTTHSAQNSYWLSTGLVAVMSVFAAFVYLSGGPQVAHVGYPQHLRIIL